MTLRISMAIAAIVAMSLNVAAHDGGKPDTQGSMMYAPLVYDNNAPATTRQAAPASNL